MVKFEVVRSYSSYRITPDDLSGRGVKINIPQNRAKTLEPDEASAIEHILKSRNLF